MKKMVSILLASCMIFASVSCSGDRRSHRDDREEEEEEEEEEKETEGTPEVTDVPETSETEAEPAETSAPTPTPTPEPEPVGELSDYISDISEEYSYLSEDDMYHVPYLLIDSNDAENVNEYIEEDLYGIESDIEEYGYSYIWKTKYIAFLSEDGILSLVFVMCGETDDDYYEVYNFDVHTGEEITDEELVELFGIDDIYDVFREALQNYYNKTLEGIVEVDNYEAVTYPEGFDYFAEVVSDTFYSDSFPEDVQIGVNDEGELFFVSYAASLGGADSYVQMFDLDGNSYYNDERWNSAG